MGDCCVEKLLALAIEEPIADIREDIFDSIYPIVRKNGTYDLTALMRYLKQLIEESVRVKRPLKVDETASIILIFVKSGDRYHQTLAFDLLVELDSSFLVAVQDEVATLRRDYKRRCLDVACRYPAHRQREGLFKA